MGSFLSVETIHEVYIPFSNSGNSQFNKDRKFTWKCNLEIVGN